MEGAKTMTIAIHTSFTAVTPTFMCKDLILRPKQGLFMPLLINKPRFYFMKELLKKKLDRIVHIKIWRKNKNWVILKINGNFTCGFKARTNKFVRKNLQLKLKRKLIMTISQFNSPRFYTIKELFLNKLKEVICQRGIKLQYRWSMKPLMIILIIPTNRSWFLMTNMILYFPINSG